jgi:hypothetical protein
MTSLTAPNACINGNTGYGSAGEAKDPSLFRASNDQSQKLAAKPRGTDRIYELVNRRLKNAGLSPHSFRVMAITALFRWASW